MNALCIAVSAGFTAGPLDETLAYWWNETGVEARARFAPYNQVFQSLLSGTGPLAENRHGANVVLVNLAEWLRGSPGVVDDLAAALRHCADLAPVPHLLVCCPPAPGGDPDQAAAVAGAEAGLARALHDDARIRVITAAEVAAQYPVSDYHDDYGRVAADVPYTRTMFAALATVIVRAVHATLTPRPKVIAVDADNTLWDGVVGEDGVLGVRVTPVRRRLQQFLLDQRTAGRLIVLCSKNAEADVLDVLAQHPDMMLRPEHVTAHRINWRPKSANLADLAGALNLAPDSFVLIDDNPLECAEVAAALPEVLTLTLPADPDDVLPFLEHCWPLDRIGVTNDDRERADRYRTEVLRDAARTSAPSLAGFLDGLGLVVDVRPVTDADLARTAQLTQRTNQFNLTTIRRSAADLATADPGTGLLAVDVRDRFGSYGHVGVVVHRTRGDRLDVETLLLSCRVLGRGVEHRVLAALGRIAANAGLAEVALRFVPTARNQPAYDFLTALPGVRRDGDAFVLSTPDAVAVTYRAPDERVTTALPVAPGGAAAAVDRDLVHRIATTLRTPAQVLVAVDAAGRGSTTGTVLTDDPTEARVARIWADLLEFPPTSVQDNFHELGGHSLALVRFAVRVRDEFGVELPIDALFTDAFTVADVARTIRALDPVDAALAGLDDADLDALLDELDGLSDEDVRALLDADR